MKMLKRFSAVILITLAFLTFTALTLYESIKVDRVIFEESRRDVLELKFEYIKGVISENSLKAKAQIEEVSERIVCDIQTQIPDVKQQEMYLKLLNDPKPNIIIDIIAERIRPVYLNVQNDGNDPWVANLNGIISDYSADCSAAGRSRSFEAEIAMHTNKLLATRALERILTLDVVHVENGRLDDMVFWEFKKSPMSNWSLVDSMTIEELYTVFHKYNGDLRSLSSYEFLYPNYIYSDRDILGREIVNGRGEWQGTVSFPLIIVQGWNLYDAITSNQTHKLAMTQFDAKLRVLTDRQHENEAYKTLLLIAIVAIFLIVQLSTVQIIHNETKRMIEEGEFDDEYNRDEQSGTESAPQ